MNRIEYVNNVAMIAEMEKSHYKRIIDSCAMLLLKGKGMTYREIGEQFDKSAGLAYAYVTKAQSETKDSGSIYSTILEDMIEATKTFE